MQLDVPILIEVSREFVYAISRPSEGFDFSDDRFMAAKCKTCGDSGFVPAIYHSPVFCACVKGNFRSHQWLLEEKHDWPSRAWEREGYRKMDVRAANALGINIEEWITMDSRLRQDLDRYLSSSDEHLIESNEPPDQTYGVYILDDFGYPIDRWTELSEDEAEKKYARLVEEKGDDHEVCMYLDYENGVSVQHLLKSNRTSQ